MPAWVSASATYDLFLGRPNRPLRVWISKDATPGAAFEKFEADGFVSAWSLVRFPSRTGKQKQARTAYTMIQLGRFADMCI
jgi:hypothetical protein